MEQEEIDKVHQRVHNWFAKPHQFNSTILIAFMGLMVKK